MRIVTSIRQRYPISLDLGVSYSRQNGWFTMNNPILKWMIWGGTMGYPYFRKPPCSISSWAENVSHMFYTVVFPSHAQWSHLADPLCIGPEAWPWRFRNVSVSPGIGGIGGRMMRENPVQRNFFHPLKSLEVLEVRRPGDESSSAVWGFRACAWDGDPTKKSRSGGQLGIELACTTKTTFVN